MITGLMIVGLGKGLAMSSAWKNDERLAGKLMLSTALVAMSAGYVWWQAGAVTQQKAAALAAMQQVAPAQTQAQIMTPASGAAPQAATSDLAAPVAMAENAPVAASSAPKPTTLAMAAPTTAPASNAAPQAQGQQNELLPAAPPPPPPPPGLTGMAAIRAYVPTEGISPPLPPTMGTPDAGALPPIPAGMHLQDGEFESDKVQFEWGDLRVKIFVASGKINGVQIMSYPDHRSQSLYLIQLADPILNTEVIKTQQAKVDVVSSATNSSYAYQDAVTNAISKAVH
jgi:uncharacterized protein with FMN-binding domain